MTGIGVIGYGYWGPQIARNFAALKTARLVAVCDCDEERLALARTQHPDVRCVGTAAELLEDADVDAVVIATPASSHFELADSCLSAGKHVLVEKPLATSSTQARALVRAAADKHRVLLVDHTYLYSSAVQTIAAKLASGELGAVYYYDSVRINLGRFRSDVDVLWDLASHDLSILDYLFDDAPTSLPYLDWFQDQYRFAHGTNFREFLARYPADLAVIDLGKEGCWRNFVRAEDWHLLFYGPTAAVFKQGAPRQGHRMDAAAALRHLRNARTAFTVFNFSVVIGDYATTWSVLTQLETALVSQADPELLKRAQSYRAAHAALARGDYDGAESSFDSALNSEIVSDRDLLILTLLHSRRQLLEKGNTDAAQTVTAGLKRLALQSAPLNGALDTHNSVGAQPLSRPSGNR